MDEDRSLDEAVIVAVGGNLKGDYPTLHVLLDAALERFPEAGLRVLRRSGWWRSAAWPDPTGPEYLNGVVLVETTLAPRQLLGALLTIETAFGRRRAQPNAPRTLDLDLVAYARLTINEPGLTLPHPRAHERRFVMGPLAEIAPGWRHPVLGRTATSLSEEAIVGEDARPG